MNDLTRVIEFNGMYGVASHEDTAAAAVGAVVRASREHKLLVTGVTLRISSMQFEVDLPRKMRADEEGAYLHDVGHKLQDAVRAATGRAGALCWLPKST